MPQFVNPDGSNPWGLRLTNFHRGLARVTPEEVQHYSTAGYEEAMGHFREHSRAAGSRTESPYIFSKESAKNQANKKSGIPEVEKYDMMTAYLQPSSASREHPSSIRGCNTCGFETKGCKSACFSDGGRLQFQDQQNAMQARTMFAFTHPAQFLGVAKREIDNAIKNSGKSGRRVAVRFGGTHEGLVHLMRASEAIIPDADADFIEYTKAQSGDVVPHKQLIRPNYPNLEIVQSITENTTARRARQASEEQGMTLAVPVRRSPKKGTYPETGTLIDRTGNQEQFRVLRDPVTRRSQGDIHDVRSQDRAITGITGGLLYLGQKRIRQVDPETGKNTMAPFETPFLREVNPSLQASSFMRHGIWKGGESSFDDPTPYSDTAEDGPEETPVSLRRRK